MTAATCVQGVANWTEASLAVNRALAICLPHQYSRICSRKVIIGMLLCAWVIVLASVLPSAFSWGGHFMVIPVNQCTYVSAGAMGDFFAGMAMFVPMVLSGTCCAIILLKSVCMQRHQKDNGCRWSANRFGRFWGARREAESSACGWKTPYESSCGDCAGVVHVVSGECGVWFAICRDDCGLWTSTRAVPDVGGLDAFRHWRPVLCQSGMFTLLYSWRKNLPQCTRVTIHGPVRLYFETGPGVLPREPRQILGLTFDWENERTFQITKKITASSSSFNFLFILLVYHVLAERRLQKYRKGLHQG